MARYFIRPKSWWDSPDWWDNESARPETITVMDAERSPVRTGLLDKDGNDIMKAPATSPVGFIHFGKQK